MTTLQLPVLISATPGYPYVAELLDGADQQATGTSLASVMQRLQRSVAKIAKAQRLHPAAEWEHGELLSKSFPVQPMYIHEGRRYLAGPPIQFPVRYVRLLDQRGSLYCLLPDLGEQFYCPEETLFPTMLSETVRSLTATLQPDHIWQFWPPPISEFRWVRAKMVNRFSSMVSTPKVKTLQSVAEPLVGKGQPFFLVPQRSQDEHSVMSALARGSCLIVGESGVGKSAILRHVARKIQREERQRTTAKERRQMSAGTSRLPRFWLSSGGRLIAGMQYLGQWQERLEAVIAELSDSDAVLAIENITDLVRLGGGTPRESLAAFMLPYIQTGQLRLVVEATPEELDACRRWLPAFVDALPVVRIEPLTPRQETNLLDRFLKNDARDRKSTYDSNLADTIRQWCFQFQRHAAAPGPSVEFLKTCLASRPKNLTIDEAAEKFIQRTGLLEIFLRDAWTLERAEVTQALQKEVIGQDAACDIVAGVVTRIKSALNDPQRPFACLLFCGPTGVGKTQLSKSLARYLFGHGEGKTPMVRLDMSEYAGVAAGHRFLLDNEDRPATWIQQIRSKPLSLLLFDEIEKASPEVFDILLSLLDEGRLTDRTGKVTSFRNTVVIMTSNLGARQSTAIGFSDIDTTDYVSEVRRGFRPEFFNRLDHVVPFLPLNRAAIQSIARKELSEVALREGIRRSSIRIKYTDKLVEKLAEVGFDSHLGARPLQRTIETRVVAPLARDLLAQRRHDCELELDWDSAQDQLLIRSTS